MKKIMITLFILFLSFHIISCQEKGSSDEIFPSNQDSKNEYLIGFSDEQYINQILDKYNIEPIIRYNNFPIVLASLTKNQFEKIEMESMVYSIETDGDLENSDVDRKYQQFISHQIFNQLNITEDIRTRYTGKGVKIAILDSGIDVDHESLNIKNVFSLVGSSEEYYSSGHGTHVAGIIGAKPNSSGIIGVAPDADLYSVKILNKRDVGKNSSLIAAIDWCIDNKIDIIHSSISSSKSSEILNQAVKVAYERGILLVASAGNTGIYLEESITFPGGYDSVIAVGSIDKNNKRSFFSSVGESLELMAPGENIYSTEIRNSYGQRSGTSMAAAYVTGVAALLMEKDPELTNTEVRKILNETATRLGEPFLFGNGIINAERALSRTDSY